MARSSSQIPSTTAIDTSPPGTGPIVSPRCVSHVGAVPPLSANTTWASAVYTRYAPSVTTIGASRPYATSAPMMAPDARPMPSATGITTAGEDENVPSLIPTITTTLTSPQRGPTEMSMPPLPASIGTVDAIVRITSGAAPAISGTRTAWVKKPCDSAMFRATSTTASA